MITQVKPILPSKLYIPPPRKARVTRPHLIKQLNASLPRKLTLVSAPAGYGKSTLLSEWVGLVKRPAAWLSLDQGDNDPSRFWSYFMAALRTIPGLEQAWGEEFLVDDQQPLSIQETETFLSALIIKIAPIADGFVFILDDFQNITDASILDSLFTLLENLPPGPEGMHLVIASRNDPPWPLARLRANNEITEIRAKDLSFSIDETAAFINDVMGLPLSPDEISELDQRTEGWAAGLQMAALSIRGRDDIAEFLAAFTGSHRFVLDYLVEEVLTRQKPEILDFLLKTSILARLTGPLCDSITGNSNGTDIVRQLERDNLFVVSLDDQRIWYRYHPLFADLLQKQLRSKYDEQIPALHRKASQWHIRNGFSAEAVEYALNTKDWAFAASIIEDVVLDMIQRGEMNLVRRWVLSLPDETIRSHPILCVAQAWTSTHYASVAVAEDLLAQAESALENEVLKNGAFDPQAHEMVNRQITLLQVVIARARGDSTHRQQALAMEALDHLVPTDDFASRATLFLRLGFCYLDLGKDGEADRVFSQAYRLGKSSGNYYAAHAGNYGRMVIAWRHGQLDQLRIICHETQDISTTRDNQGQSLNGIALIMEGRLLYEHNALAEAESCLVEGLKLVNQAGIAELLIKGYFSLACLNIAKGKQAPLPDLKKMTANSHPELVSYAAALQAQLQLLSTVSSKDSAFETDLHKWVDNQQLCLRQQSSYDWEISEKLTYARVLCWQCKINPNSKLKTRLKEVLNFIKAQCQTLDTLNWWGTLVEVNIVTAVVLYTLERKAEALTAVKNALDLGETSGYLRIFLDEGQPMQELLRLALKASIHKEYTRKILASFDHHTPYAETKVLVKPDDLIEPLSEREMQVLRLLNTQLSVPEIAQEIHLAPTTVRTHVQHIYQKLDVHGRLEVLQRAKQLKLI